jgi:hypothetical protein
MYFERYMAGEYEQVWRELVALGAAVRDEPVYSDAHAVARETMRRAASNIKHIIERLETMGFEFLYPEELFVIAPPDIDDDLALLKAKSVSIPLSLQAWWETVEIVNLSGIEYTFIDPTIDEIYPHSDPLWISGIEQILKALEHPYPYHQNYFAFAPDICSKDQEGGDSYTIELSQHADVNLDETFSRSYGKLTFVEYLRLAVRWGGFPGFSLYGKLHWMPPAEKVPHHLIAELTRDLLPF